MIKCSLVSKVSLLSESERKFKLSRKFNSEFVFEDNTYNQLLFVNPLSNTDSAKEHFNDRYSNQLNILESHQRESSRDKQDAVTKRSHSLDHSGSRCISDKDSSNKPGSFKETVDIADDFEMMKEKYRKWKKKMDQEA